MVKIKIRYGTTRLNTITIALIAFAILVIDALTDVDIDVPVLYVVAVLMSCRVYERRDVLIVALVCILFTVVGYALSPGNLLGPTAVANRFLAFLAIGATTFLALRDKRAAEALREAQMELAHANRVATMGQLTASVTHEVSQPIATARNNAVAAMNFLDRNPPDLEEVREALSCVVSDTDRAGDIMDRIRDQIKKAPPRKHSFDFNDAVHEVIALARGEVAKNQVSVQSRLADGLSPCSGGSCSSAAGYLELDLERRRSNELG